jgi:multidrug resistance efflux pump
MSIGLRFMNGIVKGIRDGFMKKRCVFALPLLLAGCGDDLPRYLGYVDVDVVRLAPSHIGHLQQLAGTHAAVTNVVQTLAQLDAPVKAAARERVAAAAPELTTLQHHSSIRIIRTQLALAESRRQLNERHLRRLNDTLRSGLVSQSELDQQSALVSAEAARVAALRAALKSARLSAHATQAHGTHQTASASYKPPRNTGVSAG